MQTLRRNALGNFRTFVIDITKDPAMLRYLNGTENEARRPNENYGRELMELFTIGRGYYTESDVKEAARVLTGWKALNYRSSRTEVVVSQFQLFQHDQEKKVFSRKFPEQSNRRTEQRQSRRAGARRVAGHDFRPPPNRPGSWSASSTAGTLRAKSAPRWSRTSSSRWRSSSARTTNLAPLIKRMLTSDHFFDPALRGGQLRSPLDFIMGTFVTLENPSPAPLTDRETYDALTNNLL